MSPIEFLYEYRVTWKELSEMPTDQAAFVSLVSYAATELNTLKRLYLFSSHDFIGQPPIDALIAAQRHVILRYWSAKLFELSECFRGIAKTKTCDTDVLQLVETANAEFSVLKSGAGYILARNFRHEATNHYSFSAAKKNLAHIANGANCNLYLHKKDGNSFYPLGEEVMFGGRLFRQGASLQDAGERLRQYEVWFDWNLDATRWATAAHVAATKTLLLQTHPDRAAVRKPYWLRPEHVGDMLEHKTPLFFRSEEFQ